MYIEYYIVLLCTTNIGSLFDVPGDTLQASILSFCAATSSLETIDFPMTFGAFG